MDRSATPWRVLDDGADPPGRGGQAGAGDADDFPLPPDRIAAILEDLGDRIGAIYRAEVDALDMTARAIGR